MTEVSSFLSIQICGMGKQVGHCCRSAPLQNRDQNPFDRLMFSTFQKSDLGVCDAFKVNAIGEVLLFHAGEDSWSGSALLIELNDDVHLECAPIDQVWPVVFEESSMQRFTCSVMYQGEYFFSLGCSTVPTCCYPTLHLSLIHI